MRGGAGCCIVCTMLRVNGADIRKFAPQSQAKKTHMDTNSRKPAPEAAISGKVFPDLREILPARIREARGGLTGREFARRCGIKAQSLSRYERIGGQLPGAELLATFARTAFVDGLFDRDEYAEAKREAESGIRDARIVLDTHERGTRRRGELVDALLDVAANPDAVLRLPPRPLRDALRAVFGPLRVTAAKTVEPDSASVYAALCGTEAGESGLVRLLAGVLNPDGLVAAARLLRA